MTERYVASADGPTVVFRGRTFAGNAPCVDVVCGPTAGRILFVAPLVDLGGCVFNMAARTIEAPFIRLRPSHE